MIKKILTPVDFSDITQAVIDTTKFIGTRFNSEVYLLHVISPLIYLSAPETMVLDVIDTQTIEEIENAKKEEAYNVLTQLKELLKPLKAYEIIDFGNPADVIVEKEEELKVDLVILGGHQKGLLEKILLGSTSEAVVKHSKKPVLVVKGKPLTQLKKVLIAYDFSQIGDELLKYASEFLSKFENIEADIVHIEEEIELPILKKLGINLLKQIREKKVDYLDKYIELFQQKGVKAQPIFIEEREPAEGILEILNKGNYDMVMVANKGLSGLKRILIGSVSLEILRKSHISVFVFKHS
jgi:nucleotide-binding universal stress UspA family protein